jgi:hypothetical protein
MGRATSGIREVEGDVVDAALDAGDGALFGVHVGGVDRRDLKWR